MFDLIVKYLIEKGGWQGILLAIAIAWIVFRERMFFSTKKTDGDSEKELEALRQANIKEDLKSILEQSRAIEEKLEELERKTDELYAWHNIRDDEGVFVWYVRKSLEESIDKLEDSISDLKKQTVESLNHLDILLQSKDNTLDKLQEVNEERIIELKSIIENYNKTMMELSLALEKIKFVLKHKENN